MSRWVYIALAYGLAGGVLAGYLAYVLTSLGRNRRRVEALIKGSPAGGNLMEEAA